jgi:hypothetical protein
VAKALPPLKTASARHLVRRHQADGGGGRHRPEAADGDADQHAPGHVDRIVGGQRDDRAGHQHQCRQPQQQRLAWQLPRQPRNAQAGEYGERARDRDRLPGQAFAHAKILRNGRQQAHRHEFGSDQRKGRERHREDAAPACLHRRVGGLQ